MLIRVFFITFAPFNPRSKNVHFVLIFGTFRFADYTNIFFTAIDFIPIRTIFYYLKHAPLEIFALTLFSVIGFKGFFFYKKIFLKEDNLNIVIPKPKDFLVPTILLFIASFIEIL